MKKTHKQWEKKAEPKSDKKKLQLHFNFCVKFGPEEILLWNFL